jgi:hypothetical protein
MLDNIRQPANLERHHRRAASLALYSVVVSYQCAARSWVSPAAPSVLDIRKKDVNPLVYSLIP